MIKVGIIGGATGGAYELLELLKRVENIEPVLVNTPEEIEECDSLVEPAGELLAEDFFSIAPTDAVFRDLGVLCDRPDDDEDWWPGAQFDREVGKGARKRRSMSWRQNVMSGKVYCSGRRGNCKKRGRNKRC